MTPRGRTYRPVTHPHLGFFLRLLAVVAVLGTSCSVDSGSLEASLSDVKVLGAVTAPTAAPDQDSDALRESQSSDNESAALGFRLLPEADEARRTATVGFELGNESDTGDSDNGDSDNGDSDNGDSDSGASADDGEANDESSSSDTDLGASGDADPSDADASDSAPESTDVAQADAATEPAQTTAAGAIPSSSNGAISDLPWGPGSSVWVGTAKAETGYVQVFDGPDGTPIIPKYQYLDGSVTDYPMWNPTFFGGPLSLMVVNGVPEDEYVEVQLPIRPTGSTGWVRTAEFDFLANDYYVEIDIGTNRVRAWRGDELIVETAAVTGRSDRPTPVVRTYIDEKLPGPNSAYGPWMLTLAAFSDSLNTFGSAGGLPKIAMHGTNAPQLMGQYASSGCIRLPNDIISLLAESVPVGTRVDIVRT